jgi:hypothetical protein
MNPELLHILQHSLGLNRYGQGSTYRNYYVAGGKDSDKCRELVALGYMEERKGNCLSGGDPVFHVTSKGVDYVALNSPLPPKLTRSQKTYQEYLKLGDCFDNFKQFLMYKEHQRKDRYTYG